MLTRRFDVQIYGIFSEYVAFPLVFGQIMAFFVAGGYLESPFVLLFGHKKRDTSVSQPC